MRALRPMLLGWLVAVATAASAAVPSGEDLADLEARADYAYYTGDARLASRILEEATGLADGEDALGRYHYAHAAFRRLQLAVLGGEHGAAEQAGEACVKSLDAPAGGPDRVAEADALKAACAGYLALGGGLRARALALRIDGWLEEAARLAPRNARVRLTRGLALWYRSDAPPDRVPRARADFEAAAALLDTPTAAAPGEPSWGAADAWLFAGHAALAGGDLATARTAYERALLVAPEFGAARRALDGLAAPR